MKVDECCDTTNPQYQWVIDFVREFEYIIIISNEREEGAGPSAIDWCSKRIGNFARIERHTAELVAPSPS